MRDWRPATLMMARVIQKVLVLIGSSFTGGLRGLAILGVWNCPLLLSIKIWFSAKV